MPVKKRNELPQGDVNSIGDEQSLSEAVKAAANFWLDNDNGAAQDRIQSHLGDRNDIYNESASERFN